MRIEKFWVVGELNEDGRAVVSEKVFRKRSNARKHYERLKPWANPPKVKSFLVLEDGRLFPVDERKLLTLEDC